MPLLDRGCISPRDFELEAKKRNILLLSDTKIMEPDKEQPNDNLFSDNLDKMIGGKQQGDDNADGAGQKQAAKPVQGSPEQGD
jgi:hypothetical protein